MPTPPPGFVLDAPAPRRAGPPPPPEGFELDATGDVHDGDTFAVEGGKNARLSGVDAFELDQTGTRNGRVVRLGDIARKALAVTPRTHVVATGQQTYGRPVVTAANGNVDLGRSQVSSGLALPSPQYLTNDPSRLADYVNAQRVAIDKEQGAYGGTYHAPADYRRQGSRAPIRGKIAMTTEQFRQYAKLLRNPRTTPEELDAWFKAQGQPNVNNIGTILSFARQHPYAGIPGYFVQSDAMGQPVVNIHPLNESVHDSPPAPPMVPGLWDRVKAEAARELKPSEWLSIARERAAGLARGGAAVLNTGAIGTGWLWDHAPLGYLLNKKGILGSQEQAARESAARINAGIDKLSGNPESFQYGAGRLEGEALVTAPLATARLFQGPGRLARYGNYSAQGGGFGAATSEGHDVRNKVAIGAAAGPVLGAVGEHVVAPVVTRLGDVARRVTSRLPIKAPKMPVEAFPAPSAPKPPPGFVLDSGESVTGSTPRPLHMENETSAPTLVAPVRQPDRIDVGYPPPPEGFVLDPPLGRPGRMGERPTPEDLASAARRVNPEDVTPIPANAVESADEMAALSEGVRPKVVAPDERAALPVQSIGGRNRRDPLDLIGWLRTKGGIQDQAGELSVMGLNNKARDLDFARNEGFLGAVVNPKGLTLDDAANAAFEAGYFNERPSIPEFLDALDQTNRGLPNRVFHPDDYGPIDDYYKALDERAQVELASQEGAPLAYDRGQPITPADLEANQPPVTAYEDLPKVGGKVANINLANVNSRHDIRRLLQNTETAVGGFDAARRGRISHGETEALAAELGMTPDALLKRRQGQAMNAEEALAARQLLAKSGDELITLAGKVAGLKDNGGAGGELLAEFRKAWLRHAAIQEQVTGATAEAGRTLQQFRIAANSSAIRGRIHAATIEGAGGKDRLEDAAQAILDLQQAGVEPGQVNRFALEALKPKWTDKLVELWYNSLLSGPQTHAVNVLSNTMTALLQIPEHLAAATLGQLRRGSVDRVTGTELAPRIVGQLQGVRDGFRAFARTLKTGEVPDFVTKVEARSQKAISGIKGDIIRTPSRFLAAEDELFKAIARRSEIAGLAMRKAKGEGLKGEALYKRVQELTDHPTDEMAEASLDYARYVTYQQPLGPLGQSVSNMTQRVPILKLFVPFVRTPSNIIKFVTERSPAAPILKEWRSDMLAGGARRDLAAAKMILGTGFGMLVAQWAADGKISGSGPMDDNASRLMRNDGWQPYSVRIGDKWYSYQRLDPIASTMAVAADLALRSQYMTDKQADEAAMLVTASILKNLEDKTWLSGVSDFVKAMDDTDRYGSALVKRLAGSIAVPTFVAQTARTLDPVARKSNGTVDAIKARIPVVSQSLFPMRDTWGKPITNEGGVGPDFVSPIWTKTAKNDPLNAEMLAIGARFGPLPRKVGDRELSDAEYDQYQALAGSMLEAELRKAMMQPGWMRMSVDDRADEAEKIKTNVRKSARELLFGKPQRKQSYQPAADLSALPPPPSGFVIDAQN